MSKLLLGQNPGRRLRKLAFLAISLALMSGLPMRTFGRSLPVPRGTFPKAINRHREVAGYCVDSVAVAHGFVRDANGRITVFDAPGASSLQRRGTFVTSINNVGTVVGYYIDNNLLHHGFVRSKDGTVVILDTPGAGTGLGPVPMGHPELRFGQGTLVSGVNDSGTITGHFVDSDNVQHGFLRDTQGNFITFDVPGSGGTVPENINDSGEVAGTYNDPPIVINNSQIHFYRSGAVHGFRRDSDGAITFLDAAERTRLPDLDIHPNDSNGREVVTASNEDGATFVGYYFSERNRTYRGFMRDEHGALTVFDAACEDNVPVITSVSPFIAGVTDAITIKGQRFGNYQPSPSPRNGRIGIEDSSPGRGCSADAITGENRKGWLQVTRWTDTEIVVAGFSSFSATPCPFRAGDRVSISVSNAETGVGPAHFELTIGSMSKDLTPPHIASVTPVYPRAHQTFIIKGEGFGMQPTDQDSDYLEILDETVSWGARRATVGATSGGFATLSVGRWTPNEIEVTGFGGAYGTNHWTVNGGDQIKISVWNPQTGAGPTTYELTVVGTAGDLIAPRITSMTPITPEASQTIIIKGQNFGTRPPSTNQTTPFLAIEDETANWVAGRVAAGNIYSVLLSVSRWTDTEIEVAGFGGAYGKKHWTVNGAEQIWKLNAGDQIKVKVWNAQTGAGPASMTAQVSPSSTGKKKVEAQTGLSEADSNSHILSVEIAGRKGNYTLTIDGTGFGNPVVALYNPYHGDLPNFRIGDDAQLSHSEWGYRGDDNILTFLSWTGTQIRVSGFGGAPGDAITLAIWNASSGTGATWAGNVPGGAAGPRISSLQITGAGQEAQIIVKGSGFGSAPRTMPFTGDLNNLRFLDFRSHCGSGSSLFSAGFTHRGLGSADTTTLKYEAWTDTEIDVAGFAGSYGTGCATYETGDPIAISVWNTGDSGFTGPQTASGKTSAQVR
jgi:hypothetical protein